MVMDLCLAHMPAVLLVHHPTAPSIPRCRAAAAPHFDGRLQVTASSYVVCVTISAEAFNRHMQGRSIYVKQQVISPCSKRACSRLLWLCSLLYLDPSSSARSLLNLSRSSSVRSLLNLHPLFSTSRSPTTGVRGDGAREEGEKGPCVWMQRIAREVGLSSVGARSWQCSRPSMAGLPLPPCCSTLASPCCLLWSTGRKHQKILDG